jgi:hypothetical protein
LYSTTELPVASMATCPRSSAEKSMRTS